MMTIRTKKYINSTLIISYSP
jgi:hypothetical protein